ncbi:MAG: ring-cleaving dioxygenase [Chloroflexota bacterium]
MTVDSRGIHHVTAIASDPQQNLDFYAGVLGLRLVKLTVNFDDPGAYHLYYGDEVGSPGTILTFFAWPGAPRGARGTAQAATTSFAIPPTALDFWMDRLSEQGVDHAGTSEKFGCATLAFHDPDGLALELVADPARLIGGGWSGGPVAEDRTIRGVHSVTLWVNQAAPTGALLTGSLGFSQTGREGDTDRFSTGDGGPGTVVDVRENVDEPGTIAVGSVHHVAFRVADNDAQMAKRQQLMDRGYQVTPVRDRTYFHSIYFVEPGGVLFEMATNPPGFTVDESTSSLGSHLKLPSWLESRRSIVERALPPLVLPRATAEKPV